MPDQNKKKLIEISDNIANEIMDDVILESNTYIRPEYELEDRHKIAQIILRRSSEIIKAGNK